MCYLFHHLICMIYILMCLSKINSLQLQKRLAADIMKCGQNKIWLDPNETNMISNSNSRQLYIVYGSKIQIYNSLQILVSDLITIVQFYIVWFKNFSLYIYAVSFFVIYAVSFFVDISLANVDIYRYLYLFTLYQNKFFWNIIYLEVEK